MNDVARISQNGVPLVVKYAAIAASINGNNTVVAAVTGKRILVLAYNLVAAGAVNAKWRSGAATDISGLKTLAAAGSQLTYPENQHGWVRTVAGEALVLNLSSGTVVGGELTYVEAE